MRAGEADSPPKSYLGIPHGPLHDVQVEARTLNVARISDEQRISALDHGVKRVFGESDPADTGRVNLHIARGDIAEIRYGIFPYDQLEIRLLTVIVRIIEQARSKGIQADLAGLPEGTKRLLDLAFAGPEKAGAARGSDNPRRRCTRTAD